MAAVPPSRPTPVEFQEPVAPPPKPSLLLKLLDFVTGGLFDLSGTKELQARNWYTQAQTAAQKNQWERAYICCQHALELAPSKEAGRDHPLTLAEAAADAQTKILNHFSSPKTLEEFCIHALAKNTPEAALAFFSHLREEIGANDLKTLFRENPQLEEYKPYFSQLFSLLQKSQDPKRNHLLAHCIYHGIGVAENRDRAVAWFKRHPENSDALVDLGIHELHGVKKNLEEYEKTTDSVGFWNPTTQHRIATNFSKAIPYFEKAANLGNAEARYLLGKCYERQGDLDKAIPEYKAAADQGYIKALRELGKLHERFGPRPNLEEATKWYLQAYEAGDLSVCHHLGDIYTYQNKLQEAANWYLKAYEEARDPYAGYHLGDIYQQLRKFDAADLCYEQCWKQCLERELIDFRDLQKIAKAFLQAGQIEKAKKWYRHILGYRGAPPLHLHLASKALQNLNT